MRMLIPALSLAIAHIAGDNVGVVPDMAVVIGSDIHITTIFAYIVLGSCMASLSAWIGVKSGCELDAMVKRVFGCTGKKILAVTILAVCIPASAITGGYFAGAILNKLTGIDYLAAVPLCLVCFSLLAAGYCREWLRISNYVAILLIPFLVIIFLELKFVIPGSWGFGKVDWPLVLALAGYNAGGMRSVLVVESAAYLAPKGSKIVYVAVLAKIIEGLVTLMMAQLVLAVGAEGPLALTGAAGKVLGVGGVLAFNVILLCIFTNTMAPAMMLNAKQLGVITGLSFWPALIAAGIMVYMVSFMEIGTILFMMSITGSVMTVFLIYIALFLHKQSTKQS